MCGVTEWLGSTFWFLCCSTAGGVEAKVLKIHGNLPVQYSAVISAWEVPKWCLPDSRRDRLLFAILPRHSVFVIAGGSIAGLGRSS